MKTYTIETAMEAPSMSTTKVAIQANDYFEAVKLAKESWQKTGRKTMLHSGKYAVHYYHKIEESGEFTDRNTNSGMFSSGFYTKAA